MSFSPYVLNQGGLLELLGFDVFVWCGIISNPRTKRCVSRASDKLEEFRNSILVFGNSRHDVIICFSLIGIDEQASVMTMQTSIII